MDTIEILKLLGAFIGSIVAVHLWNKTTGRADKKEQADCIEKIKLEVAEHGLKIMTGHQNLEALAGKNEERFKHLENKVNQFDAIVPEVQALKVEMKGYTVKIDNLIDSIKESKTEQKESVREIKDMIRNQGHN